MIERVTTVLSFERQDRTGHTYSRTTAAWRSQRGTAQGGAGITAIVGGLLQLLLGVLRPAERSHVARWSVDAQALLGGAARGGAAAEVQCTRSRAAWHHPKYSCASEQHQQQAAERAIVSSGRLCEWHAVAVCVHTLYHKATTLPK